MRFLSSGLGGVSDRFQYIGSPFGPHALFWLPSASESRAPGQGAFASGSSAT